MGHWSWGDAVPAGPCLASPKRRLVRPVGPREPWWALQLTSPAASSWVTFSTLPLNCWETHLVVVAEIEL